MVIWLLPPVPARGGAGRGWAGGRGSPLAERARQAGLAPQGGGPRVLPPAQTLRRVRRCCWAAGSCWCARDAAHRPQAHSRCCQHRPRQAAAMGRDRPHSREGVRDGVQFRCQHFDPAINAHLLTAAQRIPRKAGEAPSLRLLNAPQHVPKPFSLPTQLTTNIRNSYASFQFSSSSTPSLAATKHKVNR